MLRLDPTQVRHMFTRPIRQLSFKTSATICRVILALALIFASVGAFSPLTTQAAGYVPKSQAGTTYYYVQTGDTLYSIATKFGTTPEYVRQLNALPNNSIYVGQRLHVPYTPAKVQAPPKVQSPPKVQAPPKAQSPHKVQSPQMHQSRSRCVSYHYVRYGQSLSSIAQYYGVNSYRLAEANNIYNLNSVYSGQYLCIPGKRVQHPKPVHPKPVHPVPTNTPVPPTPTSTPLPTAPSQPYSYCQVQPGDTVQSLAHHFGISVHELLYTNSLSHHSLYIGQQLVIPDRHHRGCPAAHHYPYYPQSHYQQGHPHYQPVAHPTVTPPPTATPAPHYGSWTGTYYADTQCGAGHAGAFSRQDAEIRFDWGYGSPGHGLPADHFSVAWTRTDQFHAGTYRFFARVDDGIRVYVDDHLVIDSWRVQSETDYFGDITLSQGYHTVRVEYFEETGAASVHVHWARL